MPVIFSLFLFAFKLQNHSIKYFINSQVNTVYFQDVLIEFSLKRSFISNWSIVIFIKLVFIILIKYATMFLLANFDKLCTHLLVCVLTGAQLSQCLGQCKHLTKTHCNRDDCPCSAYFKTVSDLSLKIL